MDIITIPPVGRYTVRAPEVFETDAFSVSRAGLLAVRVDPVIVGPTHEGYQILYTRCVGSSQIAEYLRAFGGTDERLTDDPQVLCDLMAATAGQEAMVDLDWAAEHRQTGYRVRGIRNFPPDGQGGFVPYVLHPDPTIVDDQGRRLWLPAHVEVTRWIPREPGDASGEDTNEDTTRT